MNTVSFYNGYGTTYSFEIVDKIPKGYEVWNINFDELGNGYVPLCQVYDGTYDVIKSTLKAIRVDSEEDRAIIKKAVARGINGRSEICKTARQILKQYKEV